MNEEMRAEDGGKSANSGTMIVKANHSLSFVRGARANRAFTTLRDSTAGSNYRLAPNPLEACTGARFRNFGSGHGPKQKYSEKESF